MPRYEVDKTTFAVSVFVETQDPPILFQPDWPDTTPWASLEEATEWAEQYVAAYADKTIPFPPLTRGGEPLVQPAELTEPEPVEEPAE